jgi:hypothetical protein
MADLAKLTHNGLVEQWMTVPMKIRPNGSIGIEVGSSILISKHRALPRGNDHRFLLAPFFHLSEGVPDVLDVFLSQRMHHAHWVGDG